MPDFKGSILSDHTIRNALQSGQIVIHPLNQKNIQPSSVDIRLGRLLRTFRHTEQAVLDLTKDNSNLTEVYELKDDEPFILHPGEFVLGSTFERIEIGDDIVARLEGKSSLGRNGLVIHSTAGYVDPGWRGNLTLELSNLQPRLSITLRYGMKIGQISFAYMTTLADNPYGSPVLGSKYQDAGEDPGVSLAHLDVA